MTSGALCLCAALLALAIGRGVVRRPAPLPATG